MLETEFPSNSSTTNRKQIKTNNSLTTSFNLSLVEPNLDDFFQQFPSCINDDVEFEDDSCIYMKQEKKKVMEASFPEITLTL